MKKGIIALSAVAAFATTSFANSDMQLQLDLLKKQIAALEAQMNTNSKAVKKVTKKTKKLGKKLNIVKAHDAGDNIKWDIDFRTTVDKLTYNHANGVESNNDALMTNRLLLGMKYKADDKVSFYGTLGYNKAYGDSANHSQSNVVTSIGEYQNFDWVANENATDGTVKVKEAYWLYMNDTLLGKDVAWTASVGRRPSTGGLGINFREGDKRKSALAHTVNVEFDGASFKWNLDKVTPLEGSWIKLCMGRGLTNAKPRFQQDGADYIEDKTLNDSIDMVGFIFVPYDDGQYSVHTNYAKANNLIGFDGADMQRYGQKYNAYANDDTNATKFTEYVAAANAMQFKNQGDMKFSTIMFKADGLGNEINDFLDNTIVFASYAHSRTKPNEGKAMLGSFERKIGESYWIGAQMPCLLTEDGKFGVEYNKGSKYWRSMTYGEDTMAGSKLATRGNAYEIYYIKPLTKALTLNLRYTKMMYEYTGSNAFFGADGTPMTMAQAKAQGQNPVDRASDWRVSVRYKF